MAKTGYLTLQNFRYGLDARRSQLTSQPGTLLRAVDCHVNQGAEIEKRKAFVKAESLLPAGCFGLVATSLGLITFGSIPLPNGMAAWPVFNQFLGATWPAVSYMQVTVQFIETWNSEIIFVKGGPGGTAFCNVTSLYPLPNFLVGTNFTITGTTDFNGATICTNVTPYQTGYGATIRFTVAPNVSHTNTTGLVSWPGSFTGTVTGFIGGTVFNGNPLVALSFNDGSIKVFYNGNQVGDFTSGVVTSVTTTDIATAIATLVNTSAAFTATVTGSSVVITSVNPNDPTKTTAGDNITTTDSLALLPTSTGTLTITASNLAVETVFPTGATAGFSIEAGNVGGMVNNVYVNGTLDLLNGTPVAWVTDAPTTAIAVEKQINIATGITGYSAIAQGVTILVTAPTTSGQSINESLISLSCSNVCSDNCQFQLSGTGLKLDTLTPSGGSDILGGAISQNVGIGETIQAFITRVCTQINGAAGTYCAGQDAVNAPGVLFVSRNNTETGTGNTTYTLAGEVQPSYSGVVNQTTNNTNLDVILSVTSISSALPATSTAKVIANIFNGVGPFTYAWQEAPGTSETGQVTVILGNSNPKVGAITAHSETFGRIYATAPTKASTSFTISPAFGGGGAPATAKAVFICVVTDTNTKAVAASGVVNVSMQYST